MIRENLYKSHILFVDDDADMLNLLKVKMASPNEKGEFFSNVYTVQTRAASLEVLNTVPIDLVVLDLSMGEISGIQLLEEMKKIHPNTQALFLSGNFKRIDVVAAISLGALDFLDKPFSIKNLHEHLLKALRKVCYRKLSEEIIEIFIQENLKKDWVLTPQSSMEEIRELMKDALEKAKGSKG